MLDLKTQHTEKYYGNLILQQPIIPLSINSKFKDHIAAHLATLQSTLPKVDAIYRIEEI